MNGVNTQAVGYAGLTVRLCLCLPGRLCASILNASCSGTWKSNQVNPAAVVRPLLGSGSLSCPRRNTCSNLCTRNTLVACVLHSMYRFQTRENIDQRREVCLARPVPDDEVAWDSSLDLLWQLDRQLYSPRRAATASTDSVCTKVSAQGHVPQIGALPISCTEAPKPGPTQQDCVRAEPLRQPLKVTSCNR